MSTYAYRQIVDQFQQLSPEEQARLIKELQDMYHRRVPAKPHYNIMEFEGIAKELWKDVDVQKYLDEERKSWERDVREPGGAGKKTLENSDNVEK